MNTNITGLSPQQLRRAADIKERIVSLEKELSQVFGASAPAASATAKTGGRFMSAEARARISAAQKARWAKQKGSKASAPAKAAAKTGSSKMSPAARAKLSAKLKAYWAAKRAGQK